MNKDNELLTPDLPLSAYLLTKGHNLIRIDRAGRQGIFVFNKDRVKANAADYLAGEALCDPGAFNLSIRRLKGQLDEILGSGGIYVS